MNKLIASLVVTTFAFGTAFAQTPATPAKTAAPAVATLAAPAADVKADAPVAKPAAKHHHHHKAKKEATAKVADAK